MVGKSSGSLPQHGAGGGVPLATEETPIKFKIQKFESFQVLEFELSGVITPDKLEVVLRDFRKLKLAMSKGLVISGRGPIWLYAALIHEAHPFKWIATYDPRLDGAVIVASHDPNRKIGEIVKIKTDC